MHPPLLGIGLYPLPEAARLARVNTRTARRWTEGYTYRHNGELQRGSSVMTGALPQTGRERDLTFAELLTLRLVKGFRDVGLGLPTIKRVAAKAAADFGLSMPFVNRRFRTDGRKVFIELRRSAASNDEPAIAPAERHLIDVLTGQREFEDVVEPSLFANVEWADDIAARWRPLGLDRGVILDPRVLFGAPRVVDRHIPTAVLAAAVNAEGAGQAAVDAVAEWYAVSTEAVADALQFETEWQRKAA